MLRKKGKGPGRMSRGIRPMAAGPTSATARSAALRGSPRRAGGSGFESPGSVQEFPKLRTYKHKGRRRREKTLPTQGGVVAGRQGRAEVVRVVARYGRESYLGPGLLLGEDPRSRIGGCGIPWKTVAGRSSAGARCWSGDGIHRVLRVGTLRVGVQLVGTNQRPGGRFNPGPAWNIPHSYGNRFPCVLRGTGITSKDLSQCRPPLMRWPRPPESNWRLLVPP